MRIWTAFVILLIAPALVFAQKIRTDSDIGAPFASYRTYGWTTGTPAANPLAERRIHAAVEGQLAAKGLTPSDNPDLWVATIVATTDQQEVVANGFGGGFMFAGGYGTVVVDLYDARRRQLVWRGSAADSGSDKSEKNPERMYKGLEKMFDHYPPQPK